MKNQIIINNKIFNTQKECENYTRMILTELNITDSVKLKNNEYFNYLISLCKRHPHYNEKFKNFIDFNISNDALNKKAFALNIINNDNTLTEISWRICVTGKGKTSKTEFNSALRECIINQIFNFKNNSDLSYCTICNCSLIDKIIHVDHEKQFNQLVNEFIKINEIIIPNKYDKKDITFERLFTDDDKWIGKLFEIYHLEHATLRIVCSTCNLTRKKSDE